VHQRDRRRVALVAQVGEERGQLVGGQHALVGDGARGQRGDVEGAAGLGRGPLGPLAQHEGAPLQPGHAVDGLGAAERGGVGAGTDGLGDEQLGEVRHDRAGGRADVGAVRVDRQLAPAEDGQALLGGQAGDVLDARGALGLVDGQEGDADGVLAHRRQVEVDLGAQQRVGDLREDAGAVAGVRLGAGRTAVVEVVQGGQPRGHDLPRGTTLHVGDEGDATGVLVVGRVVQAGRRGYGGERHSRAGRGRHGGTARGGGRGGGGGLGHVTPVVGMPPGRRRR
jgi:hypothetical protein